MRSLYELQVSRISAIAPFLKLRCMAIALEEITSIQIHCFWFQVFTV
ncbi:hypothetical protein [uncultured Nostoc sp.]